MKKTKRPIPEPVPAKPYECLYQHKIHLLHINPQVYRRFVVKGDTTVVQLHHIVQLVAGWDSGPFTAMAEAHTQVETRRKAGKIVLTV